MKVGVAETLRRGIEEGDETAVCLNQFLGHLEDLGQDVAQLQFRCNLLCDFVQPSLDPKPPFEILV